jgi:serine protease
MPRNHDPRSSREQRSPGHSGNGHVQKDPREPRQNEEEREVDSRQSADPEPKDVQTPEPLPPASKSESRAPEPIPPVVATPEPRPEANRDVPPPPTPSPPAPDPSFVIAMPIMPAPPTSSDDGAVSPPPALPQRTSYDKPVIRRVIVRPQEDWLRTTIGDHAGETAQLAERAARKLRERYRDLRIEPLLGADDAPRVSKLVDRARKRNPKYRGARLLSTYAIEVPAGVEPEALARDIQEVEGKLRAYVEPGPVRPPWVVGVDDPRTVKQGYLKAVRTGVGAEALWEEPGADGEGQAFVDVEWGWDSDHEDLLKKEVQKISGLNDLEIGHGTAVIGIVAADDNKKGGVGIAPNVPSVRAVSPWRSEESYRIPAAILDAIDVMDPGDVLLIELQNEFGGYVDVPAEIDPDVWEMVALATALGIVVVEPAGNGRVDLDEVVIDGVKVFDPDDPEVDSGAILVGAGNSGYPHRRSDSSCHGRRVDCYAWGDLIDSPFSDGVEHTGYTETFGGTSGASAIIAGVALAMQGISEKRKNRRLETDELRTILRRRDLGTPSGSEADRIGAMPDLVKILDSGVLGP